MTRLIDRFPPGRVLFLFFRSIGDTVLATPCFEAVKRERRDLEIDVVASADAAVVLQGNPFVDRVLPFRGGGGKLGAFARLAGTGRRAPAYSCVLNFHGGSTSAFLTFATLATVRVGYEHYRHGWAYTHRFPEPHTPGIHTVDYRLALLEWMGVGDLEGVRPRVAASLRAIEKASQLLARSGLREKPYIVVHPGAALESKRWLVERFREVATRVREDRALCVVAVAGPGEGPLLAELRRENANAIAAFETPDIEGLIGLLSGASLFLGNDSGPAHLAAALGIPSVVVFTSSSRAAWRPLSERSVVVSADVACAPCAGKRCAEPRRHRCVDEVPVQAVLAAVHRALRGAEIRGHNT